MSVGYINAYKNIPARRGHIEFASISIANPGGELVVCQLHAIPFGSRRSPGKWGRMTGFAQWDLLEIGNVYLAVFVGDCFTGAPEGKFE